MHCKKIKASISDADLGLDLIIEAVFENEKIKKIRLPKREK
jgi:3-hydroxyacyl-CoA dehydrogenase